VIDLGLDALPPGLCGRIWPNLKRNGALPLADEIFRRTKASKLRERAPPKCKELPSVLCIENARSFSYLRLNLRAVTSRSSLYIETFIYIMIGDVRNLLCRLTDFAAASVDAQFARGE